MKKNNRISKWFNTLAVGILISATSFYACAAQLIPFQARLTNGAGALVADGIYAINFAIYDTATSGTPVNGWVESHSSVSVISGVVNVLLGSITPLNDPDKNGIFSDAVNFYTTDGDRFIGVTIGTGQEMVPRHQLIQSFHAVTADNAANFGNQPPSYYETVTNHDSDLSSFAVNNDAAIQQIVDNLDAAVLDYNNKIAALDTLLVPTGTVMAFAGNPTSVPAGWLLCDGESFTRALHPNLFAVIGTAHGTGLGGTTTFNVPDYRGRFLRGQDLGTGRDPDAAVRTDRGDGTTGDNVGTTQTDEFTSHQHRFNEASNLLYSGGGGNANTRASNWTGTGAIYTGEPSGGNETRPKNIYVNYIIKY